ncbi:Uncharacterised protein [Vibrio vulnificus]|nr:Uncharacterised protein [Vibrio vulnificus]
MHGNDDGWFGGGVLIFYGIVALLMCIVSSHHILCYYNFLLITSVCQPLSVSQLVILAKAGNHRTASVVARYYRFIASVVGFALCSCWLWQVRFQTRHLARVDEWIPVCTGVTAVGRGGGVLSVDVRVALLMFSVSSFVIPNFFLLTSVY